MELRVRVGIGSLSTEDGRAFELLNVMHERVPQWGPVLSWQDGEAVLTVSNEWPAPRRAASESTAAVAGALGVVASARQDGDLAGRFARVLEVERVSEE